MRNSGQQFAAMTSTLLGELVHSGLRSSAPMDPASILTCKYWSWVKNSSCK